MTIQQLEYVLSLDNHRHFVKAAEACLVTQPTLSMQIQKLEEELGTKLFDRTRQPLVPTVVGEKVIEQARVVVREAERLKQIAQNALSEPEGDLKLGIIPTISPYLLPKVIPHLIANHPKVKWQVIEKTTDELMQDLKKNKLDVAVLATPLEDINLFEQPLYYEEMMVYLDHSTTDDQPVSLDEILIQNQLWLLKEGHCFRSQVLALCEKRYSNNQSLDFEAGSIETLMRMVDNGGGCTIIPELCYNELSEDQKRKVKKIANNPQREISLVSHRGYEKELFINILKEEILDKISLSKQNTERKKRKNLVPKIRK